jgi:hypothetical protein
VPSIVRTLRHPSQSSRGASCAARQIASPATAGWNSGATGRAGEPTWLAPQSNCGVLTAGSCTIVTFTFDPSWRSSVRSESVIPRMANFDPQYGACSGMAR